MKCDICSFESGLLDEVGFYDINGNTISNEQDIERYAQDPDALAYRLCTECAEKKFGTPFIHPGQPNQKGKQVKFSIYQLPAIPENAISVFHEIEEPIDMSRYEKVYSGTIEASNINEALESIFRAFNINHPKDYHARSLSVGDIVELDDWYYACQRIGWKQVWELYWW